MKHPLLLELNTRCWLRDLSAHAGRPVTLADVPDDIIAVWRRDGFTDVWLMGVWTTGPQARAIALAEPNIRRQCDRVLPGWTEADLPGSPYSIAEYRVPKSLGGGSGLRRFRQRLNAAGIRLMLDFVPNHLGIDHPWLSSRPELFVSADGQRDDAFPVRTGPGESWLAHGRDPNWPGWTDTAQLDYRLAATCEEMSRLLTDVAARCDGVRCDVAMLLLRDVFEKTWSGWPACDTQTPSEGEFWPAAIERVKRERPGFVFLAECYWGLGEQLQALGFDYTYDKTWVDELYAGRAAGAVRHLHAQTGVSLNHSAHFLENHDEPRVASRLSLVEHRAAALAMLTLPGMRFVHEGQMLGARIHLPVQLGVRPPEPVEEAIQTLYRQMLPALQVARVGEGNACLLKGQAAWPGNPTADNVLLVLWGVSMPKPTLAVINLAAHASQCRVPLPLPRDGAPAWRLRDVLGTESWERGADELAAPGLFLDLPAHAAQLFVLEPLGSQRVA